MICSDVLKIKVIFLGIGIFGSSGFFGVFLLAVTVVSRVVFVVVVGEVDAFVNFRFFGVFFIRR